MHVAIALLWSINVVCAFNAYWVKPEVRCLYFNGSCVTICPRLMHPYHTRCDTLTVSQRTCRNTHVYPMGYTCGWSRCDCNGNFVLDEDAGQCVPQQTCIVLSKKLKAGAKKRRHPLQLAKRVNLDDYEDPIEHFHKAS